MLTRSNTRFAQKVEPIVGANTALLAYGPIILTCPQQQYR